VLREFAIIKARMDTIHDILHSFINHLVPHEGNDYRPHLLQRGAMILMLMLILLSFLAANFQALLWQSSDWLVGAVLPAVVVDLTNAERANLALPTLTRNLVLDQAATLKAQDMAKNSYFSHDSPTGVTPWHWFKEAGYPFVHAGENLAVYFSDSSEVVDAWMNSPTHRANIVGNQYREIGVGVARGTYDGFDTVFVVQMFGAPAAVPVVREVVAADLSGVTAVPAPLAIATEEVNLATVATENTSTQPMVAGEMSDTPESNIVVGENESETALITTEPATDSDIMGMEEATMSMDTATPAAAFAEEARTVMGAAEAISLYSGMAASSTNLAPAQYSTVDLEAEAAPQVAVLATEPSKLLQLIYLVLGGITALVLLFSVLLEWRHHRPVQTAYGIVLLMIMAGLFYVHTTIVAGAIIQ
jgi:Cysteine-rich secretory protein family